MINSVFPMRRAPKRTRSRADVPDGFQPFRVKRPKDSSNDGARVSLDIGPLDTRGVHRVTVCLFYRESGDYAQVEFLACPDCLFDITAHHSAGTLVSAVLSRIEGGMPAVGSHCDNTTGEYTRTPFNGGIN